MSNLPEQTRVAPPRPHAGAPGALASTAAAGLCRAGGLAALAAAVLVAACGGGGGGGSADSAGSGSGSGGSGGGDTVRDFPLQAAYKAFIENGRSQQFTVRGTVEGREECNGTAILATRVARDATFENRPARAVDYSNTISLPQTCRYSIVGAFGTRYFETVASASGGADFAALGVIDNQGYGRFEAPAGTLTPVPLPRFVRADENRKLGIQYLYSDASRSTPTGRSEFAYAVRPHVPNKSVLVDVTTDVYTRADVLFSRQVETYRLEVGVPLTLLQSTISYPSLQPPLELLLTDPRPLP